ncbi:hypothetical protein PVL29_013375 [Vitis rotundifolia]|uniref:Uncharacterized protein n=1 Tax=Vitis rotundifolia TaxID=103349 RepID=A0AA38ZL94_VITRO|nr:hypothetical protein PVL29_013375 [Vitis rotundifolia]
MQVNPHQMEGFNFLISNLVAENPRGGILVHAPGCWKTFMIISFMQSFLAMSSQARPLVKKKFMIRQVEDTLLYDFYFVKADSRPQQLEVLKQWSTSSSPELFVVMELPSSGCHMSPCSREKPHMQEATPTQVH